MAGGRADENSFAVYVGNAGIWGRPSVLQQGGLEGDAPYINHGRGHELQSPAEAFSTAWRNEPRRTGRALALLPASQSHPAHQAWN